MKILVIGAGKMVEAILSGLSGYDFSSWGIISKNGTTAKKLSEKTGCRFVSKSEDFGRPDWILLGVKPQQLKEIVIPDVPVISLLAAIPEKDQKKILKVTHLVRAMPNLPVRYKKGVTLLSSESKEHLSFAEELFRNLGIVKILSEKELEELTLLTGSGPALFYEFTKVLGQAFTSLSESEREALACAVFQGAATSMKGESLQLMTDAVTSKGGVTIAVLDEWRKEGLSDILKSGVQSGLKRTEELKEHLLQN